MTRILASIATLAITTGAIAAVVPGHSTLLSDVDETSMRERLSHTDMQPLEGIWEYPVEDMTVGIERYNGEHGIDYRIVMLASGDIDLLPGTVMGYIAPTAAHNKYSLWLYCERNGTVLEHPVECTATLNSDATSITFVKPHWEVKFRVSLSRFLPSLFKGLGVSADKKEEKIPVGFRKVFPTTGQEHHPDKVRYL